MSRQHQVTLSRDERHTLRTELARRNRSRLTRTHGRILLLADSASPEGYLTDARIAARVGCSRRTVARVRATFAERGFTAAWTRDPRSDTPRRRLTEQDEARVIALTLEPAPHGRGRWTLKTLAQEVIARGIVPTISASTIGQTLKKGGVPRG